MIKGDGPLCHGVGMFAADTPVNRREGKAMCPVCGRWIALTRDKRIRQHRDPATLAQAQHAREVAVKAWRRQERRRRQEARYQAYGQRSWY